MAAGSLKLRKARLTAPEARICSRPHWRTCCASRSSPRARSRSSLSGAPLANPRMSWCRTPCSLRHPASLTASPRIGRIGPAVPRPVPTLWGSRGASGRSISARKAGRSAQTRRRFSRAKRNAIASYRTGESGQKKLMGSSRANAQWFRRRRRTTAPRCPSRWLFRHRRSHRRRRPPLPPPQAPPPPRRRRRLRRNRCPRLRLR